MTNLIYATGGVGIFKSKRLKELFGFHVEVILVGDWTI